MRTFKYPRAAIDKGGGHRRFSSHEAQGPPESNETTGGAGVMTLTLDCKQLYPSSMHPIHVVVASPPSGAGA